MRPTVLFAVDRRVRYVELAKAFVASVRQLEVIFRREKSVREAEVMERAEEMDRLRPAIERLNALHPVSACGGGVDGR